MVEGRGELKECVEGCKGSEKRLSWYSHKNCACFLFNKWRKYKTDVILISGMLPEVTARDLCEGLKKYPRKQQKKN